MNREKEKKPRDANPVSKANILSKLTFWWLKRVLAIGLKRKIEEDDIFEVTNSMRSDQNTEKFSKLWKLELNRKNPSILRVMIKAHGFTVFTIGIVYSIGRTLARLLQPIFLGGLVDYFAQTDTKDVTLSDAYWYATGIVLTTAFLLLTFHPFTLYTFKISCKIRVACSGLIYQKSLRILKSSGEEGQNGKIINLLSNDLSKFDGGLIFLHDIWRAPFEAMLFFIVIYLEIGIAAIAGMAFMASFIPLQVWIGRRSAHLRMKITKRTDFRVKIMNEIFLGIQVIKMYAWEKSFAKMVEGIRKKEVNVIRSIANNFATINSFTMISKASIFLSLIAYVYSGNIITAKKVFIVSSYFNIMNLSVYSWPVGLMQVAEAYVSIKRVQEFLLCPETKDSKQCDKIIKNNLILIDENRKKSHMTNKDQENNITLIAFAVKGIKEPCKRIQNITAPEKYIRFKNATATWEQSENNQANGIFDISLEIKPGLNAIVGQVGSSKSTLLNVILGELTLDAGSLTINGSISYASQEPWIFEGSVRSNIIFIEDFDEQRYNKVVEVCALDRDFKLFPQGDATVVGEQGSSLSGGQRARVNLARAIYKNSDIYLLDDPLSAVDTHVGKHIFEKCIKDFLADKICVLVTHQLQYLKNEQNVILLNKGKIEARGPFHTLERFNKETLVHAQEDGEQNAVSCTHEKKIQNSLSALSFSDNVIKNDLTTYKEQQMTGSIKLSTYKTFLKTANSSFHVIVVFIAFVAGQFAWSGADFFVSEWVNWEESVIKINKTGNHESEYSVTEKRGMLIIIYACIMLIGTFCFLTRSFSFFRMCLKISINLHDMIFRGVTRAKMIFFNNNPSGRILNRFTKDINNVDSVMPNIMIDTLNCFLQVMAIIVINATVNPWLLIPAIVMTFLFYILRTIYIKTGRSFKRIEALSRSSIFAHVNATLQGLATVRAFGANEIVEKEFHEFQDFNTSCWYMFMCSSQWFAFWLDIVCLIFIAIVTYSFLLLEDSMNTESGKVGLAILSSVNLVGICQWGIRQSAELENQMTSVERILEYAELPPEPPLESDEKNALAKEWPQYGNIEFKSLSFRYSENCLRILRNLTFRINAKEKIGVVGRTGAGKSSIIQSLFRMAQNEGQILIDGVDIGVIGLHDLRKKISIIPQEAVLFSGSLRFNLDPFKERSDAEIWDSLEQVKLKTVISTMSGGLDCKVLDGGSNFSAGQRQLLCLARAILRSNKILILDEATANVDSETDRLIQETIRNKFADCTVITIAHRLNTIMDSDKVLVMDAGEIMELDHPFVLIQKPDGYFKRLLDQTGSSTATALTLIAKESYDRPQACSRK